eukprot:1485433-Prymnesium_polylepis.3
MAHPQGPLHHEPPELGRCVLELAWRCQGLVCVRVHARIGALFTDPLWQRWACHVVHCNHHPILHPNAAHRTEQVQKHRCDARVRKERDDGACLMPRGGSGVDDSFHARLESNELRSADGRPLLSGPGTRRSDVSLKGAKPINEGGRWAR